MLVCLNVGGTGSTGSLNNVLHLFVCDPNVCLVGSLACLPLSKCFLCIFAVKFAAVSFTSTFWHPLSGIRVASWLELDFQCSLGFVSPGLSVVVVSIELYAWQNESITGVVEFYFAQEKCHTDICM
ncbi:hypothetical protein AAFF_G00050880 [Aldrovandia affinis]|uniref:Uncharacterized protein n=1 Tax=Aldrovandia affinis TaxID=143900 RepID=A0AAD7T4L0_9TELE|nr:hypothetical protein AAFF_G00050880 [Aldrovandia affinis]